MKKITVSLTKCQISPRAIRLLYPSLLLKAENIEDTLHNDVSGGEGNIEYQVKLIKDSLRTHGVSDELSCQHVKDILVSCSGDVGLAISQCRQALATKVG